MKTVYINNLGYLQGPSVRDANRAIEVSDDIAETLSYWPSGKLWKYNDQTKSFELTVSFNEEELRLTRQLECFSVINRGKLWYDSLTETQLRELREWYQAWLDVTETSEIPVRPQWL